MPADWQGQPPRRPRSHSTRAALDAGDSGSRAPGGDAASEDDPGYGTGEWATQWHDTSPGYQDEQWQGTGAGYRDNDWYGSVSGSSEAAGGGLADLARGAASGGPARGFPPSPGQPDPVYPPDDFDAWSEAADPLAAPAAGAPDQTAHWDGMPGTDQWGHAAGTGPWDQAGTGQWDQAATGQWHEADDVPRWDEPTGQWEAGDDTHWDHTTGTSEWDAATGTGEREAAAQTGGWPGAARTGEWPAAAQTGQWDAAATGQWDQAAGSAGPDQAAGWEPAGYPGGYGDAYADEADEPGIGEDPGAPGGRARRSRRSRKRGMVLGGGKNWTTTLAGGKNRTIILAAAGAVIVAALGITAYAFLAGHSGSTALNSSSAPKLPTSQPTTANSSPGSKLGKYRYITSRATDKAPLTLGELYPAQFLINGSSFVRTADRSDKDCTAALFGSQLQTAAQNARCTQALRASYMSTNGKMIGTVGVLNLVNTTDAARVGRATDANDFVTPLAGTTGPTKNISNGTGVITALYKGHYLILVFAEFASLNAPSDQAQRSQLETFYTDLISGTANIALSNRMVNGHP